jgi:hypothetical protein
MSIQPVCRQRPVLILVGLSILLFLVSLSQKAYHIDSDDHPGHWEGLGLLLIGWVGLFEGMCAWLANPTLFVAWILLLSRRQRALARYFSAAAVALALSFLLHRRILRNEAGDYGRIIGYGAGYWLWTASCVVALAASCLRNRAHGPEGEAPPSRCCDRHEDGSAGASPSRVAIGR